MKTFFKLMLPVLAFMLASAAAYQTVESKNDLAKTSTSIVGYIHNPSEFECEEVNVECTNQVSSFVCMTLDNKQVWRKSSTIQCDLELYRIP